MKYIRRGPSLQTIVLSAKLESGIRPLGTMNICVNPPLTD